VPVSVEVRAAGSSPNDEPSTTRRGADHNSVHRSRLILRPGPFNDAGRIISYAGFSTVVIKRAADQTMAPKKLTRPKRG
jgi:hypothetical protein